MVNIPILSEDDIRRILREELAAALSSSTRNEHADQVGKGAEFASRITGLAVSTIFALTSRREIPHSKKSGALYFSRRELESWMLSNRRLTQAESAEKARRA